MNGLDFETMTTIIYGNAVEFLFGNFVILGVVMTVFFFLLLISTGVDFRTSTVFLLPFVGTMLLTGWLGASDWLMNALLFVIAIIYAKAITKLWGL